MSNSDQMRLRLEKRLARKARQIYESSCDLWEVVNVLRGCPIDLAAFDRILIRLHDETNVAADLLNNYSLEAGKAVNP